MITKKTLLQIIPIVTLFVLGWAVPVSAMTITPVRYEIQGNPGDTLTKEMTIINDGSTTVKYYSSFANFEAQGETGSASFVTPKDDIGTWMMTDESVTLAPGEQKTVAFIVKIPKDAEPGGHFGVIFWGTAPENSNGDKQVSVTAKTGLLVLLSVSGDVKQGGGLLSYNTLDNKFWYNSLPVSFVYRFQNSGGDRLKPLGLIKIKSFGLLTTNKLNANEANGNILPNSTRKFNVDWVKYKHPKDYVAPTGVVKKFFDTALYQWRNFAVGLFSANLNLTYGLDSQIVNKKVFFFVFPWQMLICLIIIITIVYIIGKFLLKRYNNYIIKAHSARNNPGSEGNV